MTLEETKIKLELTGSRAAQGIGLTDLESFIQSFLRALRDYERSRRNAPMGRSGHPERSATAATAFRLTRLEPGSTIATLEPDLPETPGDELTLDAVPYPVANLLSLVEKLESDGLPADVGASLEVARGTLGGDGVISVVFPDRIRRRNATIDALALTRGKIDEDVEEALVTSISGRLHRLELEPEKIGVRTASGVDWHCSYPERLQQRVMGLVGQIVSVRGEGYRTSPLCGTLMLQSIDPVEQGVQSTLFTAEQIDDTELLADQGISRPQGLAALEPDEEWDELDDAYVAALLDQ